MKKIVDMIRDFETELQIVFGPGGGGGRSEKKDDKVKEKTFVVQSSANSPQPN